MDGRGIPRRCGMTMDPKRHPLMRLAVVDPTGNDGGAMRFVRGLLPAIKRVRPDLSIRYFGNGASLARDAIAEEFASGGVDVAELGWTRERTWKSKPLRERMAYKARRRTNPRTPEPAAVIASERDQERTRELRDIDRGADLLYFPWLYGLPVPSVTSPAVVTIHDLNFKYFFGVRNFTSEDVSLLDGRVSDWLRFATPIASSEFMAAELARFYPSAAKVPVVRLAPFASVSPLEIGRAREVVAALGLEPPYVLCPTHLSVHKNVGPLLAAHERLTHRFPQLKLVLTGLWTSSATGHATPIGTARDGTDNNVIGLGYVSNEQIDSLIECASVVVNPSLYEAGNGSGLDAWSRGVPVAMSDIPSFSEHVRVFGVEATLFDPRNPVDIADKIGEILDHPDEWLERGSRSQVAIQGLTWDRVARDYLDVFEAALAGGSG